MITERAETWQYMLPARPESVAEARRRVRGALGPRIDDELFSRIELVVSELVTNAVLHGPDEEISLKLMTKPDGGVSGEVVDQGDGQVAICEEDPGRIGGLGLRLVDNLTSAWGVYPDTTHVWFRFDAA